MKKLNRKGFTLIELLAVIVILAIIIALVFPQITNVIDNSKISTIHSNAKNVVNWWETTLRADELISDPSQQQISNEIKDSVTSANEWKCIKSITGLADLMKLNANDYNLDSTNTPYTAGSTVTKNTCSALKYTANGGLEVLLVAKSGGKNYIAGKVTYAFSTDENGKSETTS